MKKTMTVVNVAALALGLCFASSVMAAAGPNIKFVLKNSTGHVLYFTGLGKPGTPGDVYSKVDANSTYTSGAIALAGPLETQKSGGQYMSILDASDASLCGRYYYLQPSTEHTLAVTEVWSGSGSSCNNNTWLVGPGAPVYDSASNTYTINLQYIPAE